MKNFLIIVLLAMLIPSCSAEWHIHQAIKKNPHYGDSTKITQLVIVHDTIHDTILVPDYKFSFTVDSLSAKIDSMYLLYEDSIFNLYTKIDSLGKRTFQGKVKEKKIPYEVIVHDTLRIESKCPPTIEVGKGLGWYIYLIIGIFVGLSVAIFLKR